MGSVDEEADASVLEAAEVAVVPGLVSVGGKRESVRVGRTESVEVGMRESVIVGMRESVEVVVGSGKRESVEVAGSEVEEVVAPHRMS